VANNLVYRIGQILGDGGGVYTRGFQPGTVLRGNVVHDIVRHQYWPGQVNTGIYLDDYSRGILVESNVVFRVEVPPLKLNGTRAEYMSWGVNMFDLSPEQPEFPSELVDQAGLEPPYRAYFGVGN
jgi:hypothetical protein